MQSSPPTSSQPTRPTRHARSTAFVTSPAKGVKVTRDDGHVAVELHLSLAWGAHAGEVGAGVQANVAECLARMADVRPDTVDVIVDEWHSASSG